MAKNLENHRKWVCYLKEMQMNQTNASLAETFYATMREKNIGALEKYVHPNIELITPLGQQQGKAAYLEALKNFTAFFDKLTIRTKFAERDQALIVIDLECPAPIGKLPTASLMTFQDGLISRIEIFHDTAPFHKVKNDILA